VRHYCVSVLKALAFDSKRLCKSWAVLLSPGSTPFDANLLRPKRKNRRTFATLLKGTGKDVKTVQKLIRHTDSRI